MDDSVFLKFIRNVIDGEVECVRDHLRANPALATSSSTVGASRKGSTPFFFVSIRHYLYAGDTALHMAAAAFSRPVAELLVAHGADHRARNRRGAGPLHYAADTNHWDPTPQADVIAFLLSIGSDPAALDKSGVAPLHRAVRTRSEPAVRALLDGGQIPGSRIMQARRLCIWLYRPPGEAAAAATRPVNNRPRSFVSCWNAALGWTTGTCEASRFTTPPVASGFGRYSSKRKGLSRTPWRFSSSRLFALLLLSRRAEARRQLVQDCLSGRTRI